MTEANNIQGFTFSWLWEFTGVKQGPVWTQPGKGVP